MPNDEIRRSSKSELELHPFELRHSDLFRHSFPLSGIIRRSPRVHLIEVLVVIAVISSSRLAPPAVNRAKRLAAGRPARATFADRGRSPVVYKENNIACRACTTSGPESPTKPGAPCGAWRVNWATRNVLWCPSDKWLATNAPPYAQSAADYFHQTGLAIPGTACSLRRTPNI